MPETPVGPVVKKPRKKAEKRIHSQPANGDTLSRTQIMQERGWSSTYLWRAMRFHGLPFRKLGGKLWFIRAEVDAWSAAAPGQHPAA